MRKEVKHIDCPKEWEVEDDYSSHRPLLYLVCKNNIESRPFIEFGSGYGSTPLLREYCKGKNTKFLFESYDTDKDWALLTGAKFVNSFKNVRDILMGCIVFIDGKPGEERKDLIKKYEHNHLLVVHDTEEGALDIYGIRDILNSFKYRLDFYPQGMPGTTALSNTINVCSWV